MVSFFSYVCFQFVLFRKAKKTKRENAEMAIMKGEKEKHFHFHPFADALTFDPTFVTVRVAS